MEEDNGLTFTDVLKVILKRIWWVVGSMALALIAVVLIIQLWYNPTVNNYTVSFEISYPDSESGKYPDGSAVLLSDSISYDALKDVVSPASATGEINKLGGIDVRKMVDNDDISVVQEISKSADESVKRVYTLSVKAKYFKDDDQAAVFIRKVASYPVVKVNEQITLKNYRVYLEVYEEATTYEDKINALLLQKKYLETNYNSLVIADSDVETNLAQLNNLFTNEQKQYLQDTIVAKYYVLDTDNYLKEADLRKDALDKQIADNLKIIEAEESKRGDSNPNDVNTNPYDQIIADLTRKNAEMANEKQTISDTLTEIGKYTQEGTDEYKAKQAFDASLDEYYNKLAEATENLKTVSVNVYKDNTRVIFSNNKIEKKGGMGVITSALIGAVLGLIISAAVICIIYLPKYKKGLLATAQSGRADDTHEEPEQLSQEDTAAESDDKKTDEE